MSPRELGRSQIDTSQSSVPCFLHLGNVETLLLSDAVLYLYIVLYSSTAAQFSFTGGAAARLSPSMMSRPSS